MTAVPHPRDGEFIIWGVHVTGRGPDGDATAGPIESLHSNEPAAKSCAKERSRDSEVWAAAVTSYVVDQPGTRRRVGLYVGGVSQKRPYCADSNHQWARG